MTKAEREELMRFICRREKTLKSAARQRSTDLLAEFDSQLAAEFSFDDDPVWEKATKAATPEVEKAQEVVAARCVELGILGNSPLAAISSGNIAVMAIP